MSCDVGEVTESLENELCRVQNTGAQITLLRGKRFNPSTHCCDVTKPPYLLSGELCTSPFHSKRLFVYTVCCRRSGQCFSVLGTRKSDVRLTQWATVVGEVTSPSSDTMCHSCAPVVQSILTNVKKAILCFSYWNTKLMYLILKLFVNVSFLKVINFKCIEINQVVQKKIISTNNI